MAVLYLLGICYIHRCGRFSYSVIGQSRAYRQNKQSAHTFFLAISKPKVKSLLKQKSMKRILTYIAWLLFALSIVWCILVSVLNVPCLNIYKNGGVILATILGTIAAIPTYQINITEKRNRVFARMNKVFVKDENIQAVIRFMNNGERKEPSINELELFLRFFEELDVYVKAGDIDKKVVYLLFYYYCNQLIHAPEYQYLREKMDFNLENWKYLKDIDDRMQKCAKKNT